MERSRIQYLPSRIPCRPTSLPRRRFDLFRRQRDEPQATTRERAKSASRIHRSCTEWFSRHPGVHLTLLSRRRGSIISRRQTTARERAKMASSMHHYCSKGLPSQPCSHATLGSRRRVTLVSVRGDDRVSPPAREESKAHAGLRFGLRFIQYKVTSSLNFASPREETLAQLTVRQGRKNRRPSASSTRDMKERSQGSSRVILLNFCPLAGEQTPAPILPAKEQNSGLQVFGPSMKSCSGSLFPSPTLPSRPPDCEIVSPSAKRSKLSARGQSRSFTLVT